MNVQNQNHLLSLQSHDLPIRFVRQMAVALGCGLGTHENPTWGYDRIQVALANIGHDISDQSVGNILKKHGIEPVPDRKRQTTWTTFIKAHWDVLGAIVFTTIEVWTKGGLITFTCSS